MQAPAVSSDQGIRDVLFKENSHDLRVNVTILAQGLDERWASAVHIQINDFDDHLCVL